MKALRPSLLVAERYQLQNLLGQGGEACLYQALDQGTQQLVALRFPRETLTEPMPSWPKLEPYPSGWIQGFSQDHDPDLGPFQVLELLQGASLAKLVSESRLTLTEQLHFIRSSLEAVGLLHEKIGFHGDLNAHNFFLHDHGENSHWKLLELPFLNFHPARRNQPLFGQIHVLAPELLAGSKPNEATDLYALGCLYYYALSGLYPHPGDSTAEIAIHGLRFPPIDLQESAPSAPDLLSDWVMTFLHPSPQDRFASLEMADSRFRVVELSLSH